MGHGRKTGMGHTYRPGEPVPDAVAVALGNGLSAVSGEPSPGPSANTDKRYVPPTTSAPAVAPVPGVQAPAPPPPPPAVVVVGVPQPPVAAPTSKRALAQMKGADVEALATQNEIVVGEDVKGRLGVIRDLLAAKLNLQ